jgi:hypothetical protein
MIKVLSVALVLVGVVMIILGLRASEGLNSQVTEIFTGQPSDRAIWYSVGGAIATVVGLVGLLRRER